MGMRMITEDKLKAVQKNLKQSLELNPGNVGLMANLNLMDDLLSHLETAVKELEPHFDLKSPDPNQQHPLQEIFLAAIKQVTEGKGVRHGGAITPFMEQPWYHYYKLHGRGFLTGQAAKKLEEAASGKKGVDFINELLGAIVYCSMAILTEQEELRKYQPEYSIIK